MTRNVACVQEAQQLRSENDLLKQQLQSASEAWLPVWTHGHYDSYVAPGVKVYKDVRFCKRLGRLQIALQQGSHAAGTRLSCSVAAA